MSLAVISICLAYFGMPNKVVNAIARYVCYEKWCIQRDSKGKLYRVLNPVYFTELSSVCLSKYDAFTPCSVVLNNYARYDEASSIVLRRRVCANGDIEIIMYITINMGFDVCKYIYILYTVSSYGECTFVKGSFLSNTCYIPLQVDKFRIENGVIFVVYGYSQIGRSHNSGTQNFIRALPPVSVYDSISNLISSINPENIDEYVENDGYDIGGNNIDQYNGADEYEFDNIEPTDNVVFADLQGTSKRNK